LNPPINRLRYQAAQGILDTWTPGAGSVRRDNKHIWICVLTFG
jgi:hypothetical protein